jgi:cation diffusion facilitator CzcD-associated flavoprotein CzcO
MTTETTDGLIIGAGVAGLAAAETLCSAKLTIGFVEARDRVGGRILTVFPNATTIPLDKASFSCTVPRKPFRHGGQPDPFALEY